MAVQWAAGCAKYLQYDGTNSAEVVSEIEADGASSSTDVTIISETGGVLTIRIEQPGYLPPRDDEVMINEGDWIYLNGGYAYVILSAVFSEQYIVKP